ncbi:MAG TPA: EamA family transporter [Dongiaceae bacterium]|nr:EamA family transporter [Dongiaceae bacterium]
MNLPDKRGEPPPAPALPADRPADNAAEPVDAGAAPAARAMPLATIALLVVVTVVWGFNFAVVKAGLSQLPPIAFVALRFAIVAAMLLPWLRLPRRKLVDLILVSVILGVVHFSLMFTGMRGLDVSTAAIAIQLQVPFAAILAVLFLDDKLGWRRMTGMAIAFAGVVLIAGEPRLAGNLLPLCLVIAAACVWAGANILIKRIGDDIDVISLNGWIALLAAPQLALVSWATETGQIPALLAADWRLWASLAFQALLVTVFGYAVWYQAMRRYPVNQVMPLTLLVPLFGVMSGVIFFDERLTWPMLIGGLCTIAGVAIVIIRRPRVIAPSTRAGL